MTKVGFVSLGCNKNLCDTENMLGLLARRGYEIVNDPAEAEVIVVNTCGFIDSAKEESINTILEMAGYKNGSCRLLVAAGCLAQRYHEDIRRELPEVDVIVGATAIDRIAEAIEAGLEGKNETLIDDVNRSVPDCLPRVRATPPHTAYIKIAEGCSNRCTYCAIPSIRGRYRSRPMENVLAEARALAADGVKELIVVAQDTTRYGEDLYGERKIAPLLRELCKIDGIKWVRVHYSYPEAVDDELIEALKTEAKLVKYLDMPVQHGDDEVLRRMGRRANRRQILELTNRLRREIPEIVIRTSLIVGFPGETEEQFQGLLSLMEEARFDRTGVFAYSAEEGTPAARLPEQIDEAVKERRRAAAMELAQRLSLERNRRLLGETLEVMTDGFEDGLYYGRSGGESLEADPLIYFGSTLEPDGGDIVRVKILDAGEYDLYGQQVE